MLCVTAFRGAWAHNPGGGKYLAGTKVVLVVDDDETIQRAIVAILKREPDVVTMTASTVAEAKSWGLGIRPHLLLVDIKLADGNGVQLASDLLELYGRGVPVVLVSGLDRITVARFARELGAFGVVSKPFTAAGILEVVRAGLAEEAAHASGGPAPVEPREVRETPQPPPVEDPARERRES